jgi:hypothetical protein
VSQLPSVSIEDTTAMADAVAQLLKPLVPESIALDRAGTQLFLQSDALGTSTFDLALVADQHVGSRVANARTAVIAALNFVQDYVERYATEPWPVGGKPTSAVAITSDDEVTVGYGGSNSDDVHLSIRLRRST